MVRIAYFDRFVLLYLFVNASYGKVYIMTKKVRMYFDFDGVFNAPEPPYADVEKFSVEVNGSAHLAPVNNITYSPSVVNRIERLRANFNVELVWLSSWNDENHILAVAPFMAGLHEGRVIDAALNHAADNSHDWTFWKAEAILADQLADPCPFVWVDDNAPRYHGLRITSDLENISKKIIVPDSKTGLTISDLDEIESFIKLVS